MNKQKSLVAVMPALSRASSTEGVASSGRLSIGASLMQPNLEKTTIKPKLQSEPPNVGL
jgi:hypothetical protein